MGQPRRTDSEGARSEAAERRRLDAAFGDTTYSVTGDESHRSGEGFSDQWWSEQRPPHHG